MSTQLSATVRTDPPSTEQTLDPGDWEPLRTLGHAMLDHMIDFQRDVRSRPVWTRPTDAARRAYSQPLPRAGFGIEAAYDSFREHILPHAIGNFHPRFWGWVCGTGSVSGMLAEMLASGMNGHASFGDQAATHIERQVISWCAELVGYPGDASGVLVTSGSVAEITAMIVARDAMLPGIHDTGLRTTQKSPVVYASAQVHNSLDKAIGIIGIGRANLRKVAVDAEYRIRPDELEAAIVADLNAGNQPVCLVASAGTVNTGATDDLVALTEIARRYQLWFHVDAAFGIGLATSKRYRGLLEGIEQTDSISFDFHKWFHVPYDAACTLIRDPRAHRVSFSPPASYLAPLGGGLTAGGTHFGELGMDLSRAFRALKVWMTFMEHGIDRFGALVEQNVAQAQYLASLIRSERRLHLAAPVPMNVVTFRFVGEGLSDAAADDVNRKILVQLHETGVAVPSHTVIDGHFVIRVAITNHRSQQADFDLLVHEVVRLGEELVRERENGATCPPKSFRASTGRVSEESRSSDRESS